MCENDRYIKLLKGLRGVIDAFYLDGDIKKQVQAEENNVKATGGITVCNLGYMEALKREKAICIVKDPRFRPPPKPTVILLSGDGQLLGTEVFPETSAEYRNRDDVVWLSDGFVLFPNVKVKEGGKEAFIMPPVPFPELNEEIGCYDVISCSPAPTCDKMIRAWHGMDDNGKYASILVAFNTVKAQSSDP